MIIIPKRSELRKHIIESKYDNYCERLIESIKSCGHGYLEVARSEIEEAMGLKILAMMEEDFNAAGYKVSSYEYGSRNSSLFWIRVEI